MQREFVTLAKRDELSCFYAVPEETDIFTWHYVIFGMIDCPYEGGYYHGMLKFPANYPFAAPEIYMVTPNGRFHLNKAICMSFSNFHPESWSPAWGVDKIMLGILSFMQCEDVTYGMVTATDEERRRLARQSKDFNLRN